MVHDSPYKHIATSLTVDDKVYNFYDLNKLNDERVARLPYSIRVLLESAIRNCDNFHVKVEDVETILNWNQTQHTNSEIPYKPARVLLQDFTGVPAVVDLAAMRDAVADLKGDPSKVNPICPVDLVIDHSVQVDFSGNKNARAQNEELEFERNSERFNFLKWGSRSFNNLRIIPPGSGIVHQVNLEYLARHIMVDNEGVVYPDSCVGTDSHTTMICGAGILGWGVGGIEAEAVMLGQAISMVLPKVVGVHLTGELPQQTTATDLVLTITEILRSHGVVGKFVEFYGEGVKNLSVADRATISNMCPEYGATASFFPYDKNTEKFLRNTGRNDQHCDLVTRYMDSNMFSNDGQPETIQFSEVIEVDMSKIVNSLAGPKRPQDRVQLKDMKEDFGKVLTAPVSFKGFGLTNESVEQFDYKKNRQVLSHGSVVIAAITSCTNTSNPTVMLAAGLVARKAKKLGLTVPKFVKTSLSPGSGVVSKYLEASELLADLESIGYHITGYGCMTCIGNSGPIDKEVADEIEKNNIVAAGVLSGNRNFEGRIHPSVRANYLASPPLVVLYSLLGNVQADLNEVVAQENGKDIRAIDLLPTRDEIAEFENRFIKSEFFNSVYGTIEEGSARWKQLECPDSLLYPWDDNSSYIKKVPFFEKMENTPAATESVSEAHCLLLLGDSITTDHISPAGAISEKSPAARYLGAQGVQPKDFNSYGSRRGNHEVMLRGTFANRRIVNKMVQNVGPQTVYVPNKSVMDVSDAAEKYSTIGKQVIVLAGKEYGSGSSRDWAAKGPYLLGVRAVIAESYERIHRSNLVGMGVLPLEFLAGETADSHELDGHETFSITIPEDMKTGQNLTVTTSTQKTFQVKSRLDTDVELAYYRHGGILQYMVRKMISE
ncbi:unnamed protein product [Auanema sp. JU1783]|nr:unnamed protein product [Auanema sp. JU1783]